MCMNTCVSESHQLVCLVFLWVQGKPRQIDWKCDRWKQSCRLRHQSSLWLTDKVLSCRVCGLVFNLAPQPPFSFIMSFFHFSISPLLVFLRTFCLRTTALLITPLLPPLLSSAFFPPPPSPSPSPSDLDVKASQAVWSLSAGCQGRDTAHWDPEWDKLTVTMFPLSMWSLQKEKVKRRAWWLRCRPAALGERGRQRGGRAGRLFGMYELKTYMKSHTSSF